MKIVGLLVCGAGEADRYLKETLEEFKRLCDDVIVCFCNATIREKKMVEAYDFRSYEDNRVWGLTQPHIKTKLLQTAKLLDPDWILVLDADETVPTLDRAKLEEIAKDRDSCQFYVVNLWNDQSHYSRALSFWNVRFYRPGATPDTQFLRKPVHCGNAPPYFYALPAKSTYVPHILLHKGLMRQEDRMRKAERYQQFDPRAEHKGREYYDTLLATHTGTTYNQEEVTQKIYEYCEHLAGK